MLGPGHTRLQEDRGMQFLQENLIKVPILDQYFSGVSASCIGKGNDPYTLPEQTWMIIGDTLEGGVQVDNSNLICLDNN